MTSDEERFPREVVDAIEALNERDSRNLLAELIDGDGGLTHGELQRRLGWSDSRIRSAATDLLAGGLVSKRNDGDLVDPTEVRYEVAEYGFRVAAKLLETLGKADEELETDSSDE